MRITAAMEASRADISAPAAAAPAAGFLRLPPSPEPASPMTPKTLAVPPWMTPRATPSFTLQVDKARTIRQSNIARKEFYLERWATVAQTCTTQQETASRTKMPRASESLLAQRYPPLPPGYASRCLREYSPLVHIPTRKRVTANDPQLETFSAIFCLDCVFFSTTENFSF